jgi:hypothetical protein
MNIARDRCDPPISPAFEVISTTDGDFYVISIPRFAILPHAVKQKDGKTYFIRVGTTVREPSSSELKLLFQGPALSSTEEKLYKDEYKIDFQWEHMDKSEPYRVLRIHPKLDTEKLFDIAKTDMKEIFMERSPQLFSGYLRPAHERLEIVSQTEGTGVRRFAVVNEMGCIYFHERMSADPGINIDRTLYVVRKFLETAKIFFDCVDFQGDLRFLHDFLNIKGRQLTVSPGRILDEEYLPSNDNLTYLFDIYWKDLETNIRGILIEFLERFPLSFRLRLEPEVIESYVDQILNVA